MAPPHDIEQNGDAKDWASRLERYDTNQSSMIPPMSRETFEGLYLAPKMPVAGQLRKTFGNPTPIALMGFLVTATSVCCTLMGWRGAAGNGAALVGVAYFFGGLLQILGSVMEWIIGNTFPAVVFATFGSFWLAFAATLTPMYNAEGAFMEGGAFAEGGIGQFYASFGFALLLVTIIVFVFAVCSLRTNIVFVLVFVTLDVSLGCLTGAYWHLAMDNMAFGEHLTVISGAFLFATNMFALYLFASQMLISVDFPFILPVGDLSTHFPSMSRKRRGAGKDQ